MIEHCFQVVNFDDMSSLKLNGIFKGNIAEPHRADVARSIWNVNGWHLLLVLPQPQLGLSTCQCQMNMPWQMNLQVCLSHTTQKRLMSVLDLH